jgi:protein O-mannosyl-transferase
MKNKKKSKQAETIRLNKNKLKIYYLLLVFVPIALYFRVVNFNFTNYDDTILITNNFNVIGNIENIPKAFTVDAFFSHRTSFYRPLQTVSFIIDAQISGQNPWAYHLTNLILHVLIVIILFILLHKFGINREIALFLSLIYAVHPLLTHAVCWVPARGDLFLTLFGLLTFITFINYFHNKKNRYLLFNFIFFLLTCLAKETAVVFPFLLTLYFYFNLKKELSWKEILPFTVIWGSAFLIYFFLRNSAISGDQTSSVTGITALLKNLPAIPITFGKIFLPFGLTTMPLFNIAAVITGILVFILFVLMIIKYKVYKNPYIILGAIWFLGFTLPPLYYRLGLAAVTEEYFEHRTLLPMIGILIMLGIFFSALLINWSSMRKVKLFIPIIIIFALTAFIHSGDYSDPMTFFSAAIASNPNNVGALNARGVEYMQKGDMQKSLTDFDRAIEIYPYYGSPYFNKGLLKHSAGDYAMSEYNFSQAVKYDTLLRGTSPLHSTFLFNLAGVKIVLKKYDEAIALLRMGIKESPENGDLYNNLGYVYVSTLKYDSAILAYSRAIEIQPNSAFYYTNRGGAKYSMKDFKGALSDYSKVLELDPNSASSWYNTGNTKIELNNYEEAISDLSTALKLNPQWGDAYYHRGLVYSKLNRLKEAGKDWAEAKKLGSKDMKDGK